MDKQPILTHQAMQLLFRVFLNVDKAFFIDYYGIHLGEHLWRQFTTLYENDVVRFYNYLDMENRRIFLAAAEQQFAND